MVPHYSTHKGIDGAAARERGQVRDASEEEGDRKAASRTRLSKKPLMRSNPTKAAGRAHFCASSADMPPGGVRGKVGWRAGGHRTLFREANHVPLPRIRRGSDVLTYLK